MRVIDGYVVVDAVADNYRVEELIKDLQALGLKNSVNFGSMVSGMLPIRSINKLAQCTSLRFARPALAVTQAGLTTSQGDAAMLSDDARTSFGVDGTGINVGTLSDTYNDFGGIPITTAADDVFNGDLPGGIVIIDDSGGPGIDEGRAMMQLIADVAPGANQAFHTAFNGQANFALGILELGGCPDGVGVGGCTPDPGGFIADIIVDDVIYFAEPMFQDGIIAQAVDTVYASGISYFSSAGNNSRDAYESLFDPSGVSVTISGDTYELHDFDPGVSTDFIQSITIPAGTETFIVFQWDEPFFSVSGGAGSTIDYDIFIIDAGFTTVLASGANINIGGDPVEFLSFSNSGPAVTFNIAIGLFDPFPAPGSFSSQMKYIRFDSSNSISVNEFDTKSGTCYGHANASGAEAVGAAAYFDTSEFGTDPPELESFSSAGPQVIYFDTDGNRLIQPEIRDKPEIVAPDGTNTTFFGSDIEPDGFPNFFGTSAAAPHAAGVAALMLEAGSVNTTPDNVYDALESTAIDMDDPSTVGFFDTGFDDGSGFGLIQADLAVDSVLPQPPSITTPTQIAIVENQTGVVDIESTDPNGDEEGNGLNYSIQSGVDNAFFSVDGTTGILSFITAPQVAVPQDFNADNIYRVRVKVTDADGLSVNKLFRIAVTSSGSAPVITTPGKLSSPEGQTTVVDIESMDTDGDMEGAGLTYSIVSGIDQSFFEIDQTTGELSFKTAPDFGNPEDFNTDNVYRVRIEVVDIDGLNVSKLFHIAVIIAGNAPTINNFNEIMIVENGVFVVDIQSTDLDGDAEGSGLTYTIISGVDQNLFSVGSSTGVLSFITAPDFENPLDLNADNVYRVRVRVTDSIGLSTAQLFLVTITDNLAEGA